MGVAQLEQLGPYVAKKRDIAARYGTAFRDLPGVRPMAEADWAESAWWMYTVLVDDAMTGIDSRGLMRALEREKIQTRPLWQPLHRSPAHADAPAADCPVADRLARMALSLPCSVGLDESQQARVIERVRAIVEGGAA
jgi:perosamine synthetase